MSRTHKQILWISNYFKCMSKENLIRMENQINRKIQREKNFSFNSKLLLYKITIHSFSGVTFYLRWQVTIPWKFRRKQSNRNSRCTPSRFYRFLFFYAAINYFWNLPATCHISQMSSPCIWSEKCMWHLNQLLKKNGWQEHVPSDVIRHCSLCAVSVFLVWRTHACAYFIRVSKCV